MIHKKFVPCPFHLWSWSWTLQLDWCLQEAQPGKVVPPHRLPPRAERLKHSLGIGDTLVQIIPLFAVIWSCINSQCARERVIMSQATHKASPWDEWRGSPYSHTNSLTSRPHLLRSGEELLPTKWNSFSGGPGIPYAAWSWLTCTFTGSRRCAFRSPQTEARIKLRSDTPHSTIFSDPICTSRPWLGDSSQLLVLRCP